MNAILIFTNQCAFVAAEPIWHYEPGHYGNRYFNRYVVLRFVQTCILTKTQSIVIASKNKPFWIPVTEIVTLLQAGGIANLFCCFVCEWTKRTSRLINGARASMN